MDNKIFVATFSKDALSVAKQYGYGLEINDLCISSNLDMKNRDAVLLRIRKEIAAVYGEEWFDSNPDIRRKVIFHGPFTELTPAAIDERAILLMEDRYRETIEICDEFGVKDLVLHDGYIPLIYQRNWHVKKSVEFWKKFMDDLPSDFNIYLENVFDDDPEILSDVVDGVNDERLKICLDIGHANCMTREGLDVTAWIDCLVGRIGHFHFHNNYGKEDQHNALEEGTLDIEEIIQKVCEKVGNNATITIESREAVKDAEFFKKMQEKA